MKKLYLFTRQEDIKCNTYKNFVTKNNVLCSIMEQGDHDAELLALSLKVHNVPQFVIEDDEGIFTQVTIEDIVEALDNGEFLSPEKTEKMIQDDLDIGDFYDV